MNRGNNLKTIMHYISSQGYLLGIGIGFLLLGLHATNISMNLEYTISIVSCILIFADILKNISHLIYTHEYYQYQLNCIRSLDLEKLILMENFKLSKSYETSINMLNNISNSLIIIAFICLIYLPYMNLKSIISITNRDIAFIVFGFTFINLYIINISNGLDNHYEDSCLNSYLNHKTLQLAKESYNILNNHAKETMDIVKNVVNSESENN